MTPLEAHVNARMGGSVRWRARWDRRSQALPAPVGKFIRRQLWKWPYRHMRSYPWSVGIEPAGRGAWVISADGRPEITTVAMQDWIGPVSRPVTIVAGGPSAREFPIASLASGERLVVAVNGVPAFLSEYGVRPDVWIVSDLRLAPQIEANFPHARGAALAMPANVAAHLAQRVPEALARRSVCLIERVNQWLGVRSLDEHQLLEMNARSGDPFCFPGVGGGKSVIGWSRRPELGFFSGCTVVFAALQILIGLGARDIEIVGMDLGGKGHVYKEADHALPNTLSAEYESFILPSFTLMHEALRGSGITIRNHSPVCPLPRSFFAD